MVRLTRSKIIPANSENAGVVEKWTIPDVRSSRASIVRLEDARKQSPGGSHINQRNLKGNSAGNSTAGSSDPSENAFQEGYQQGLAAAKAEYEVQQQSLEVLLRTIESPVQGLGEQVAQELISLAVDIARLIIDHEIQNQPEKLQEFIAEAISNLPSTEKRVTVTIHPEDLTLIKSHSARSLEQFNIDWSEDPDFLRGSFQLIQDASVVQGGLNALLNGVVSQLNANVEA